MMPSIILILAASVLFYHLMKWACFYLTHPIKTFKTKSGNKNKHIILITGAVRGLGFEIAKVLLEKEGKYVHLVLVDRSTERFEQATQELQSLKIDSSSFEYISCDLSHKEQRTKLWIHVAKKHGRIHTLINNAATARLKFFKDVSFDEYESSVGVNALAYIHLTKLFLSQQNVAFDSDSHIVNIISIIGCQGFSSVRNTDYVSTKQMIHGFMDTLRMELEHETSPVRMTSIYSYILGDTNMFYGLNSISNYIIPPLKAADVAKRTYLAIKRKEEQVFIPSYISWFSVIILALPGKVRDVLLHVLMGRSMGNRKQKKED